MELYSQLHATGCFKCSTSDNASTTYPYDYAAEDECVDLCSPISDSESPIALLTASDWSEFFVSASSADQQMTIDSGCGHAALSTLNTLSKIGAIAFSDLIHFTNSLVYDERTDTCYAYDPRDAHRRRLDLLDTETCETFDCFDCAYTAG